MKQLFTLLIISLWIAGFGYGQENTGKEGQNPQQSQEKAQATTEAEPNTEKVPQVVSPATEDAESEVEDEEEVYDRVGFQIFPRRGGFSLRNTFQNRVYYDTNIFLEEDDEEDGAVYVADLESQFNYTPGRFQVGVTGGLRYEEFDFPNILENVNDNKLLPRAALDLQYQGDLFYIRVRDKISRHNIPSNIERNDRSPWVQNQLYILQGFRYKRLLMELNFFHSIIDYRRLDGDYHLYGQGLLVGYEITRRVYLTLKYEWDHIDYKKAFFITREGRDQKDTDGHNVLFGVRMELGRTLTGHISTGIQYRRSETLWSASVGLEWNATELLKLAMSISRKTVASFFADFQTYTQAKLFVQYAPIRQLDLIGSFSLIYSEPDIGEDSLGYNMQYQVNFYLIPGIRLDAYYIIRGRFSDDLAGDYMQNQVGGGVTIFF